MAERTYLSIGDVLALLRKEFPDVTISKIRFLESRGLLVPERTPSGYRKFYDHDVERLRWILLQQREHFLPLRVIKGRLEGAPPGPESQPLFEMTPGSSRESAETTAPAPAAEREEALLGARSAGSLRAVLDPPSLEMPGVRIGNANGAAGEVAPADPRPPHPSVGGPNPSPGAAGVTSEESPRKGEARGGVRDEEPSGNTGRSNPPRSGGREPVAPTEADESPSTGRPRQGETGAGGTRTAGERALGHEGGNLTSSELAEAAGVGEGTVAELESFGLIRPRSVAGVDCYDDEALAVTRIAAEFARYGVEARHLRLFRHAADRQTGLYGQVVMPVLRQRNPEARRRALNDLDRLAELGAALQASFTKAALREYSG